MKQCYQYSRGIYVHERPGQAVLTNEVELGLVSPARISKYMNWVATNDPVWLRAGDMIIPSCYGKGVVTKLVRWLRSGKETVRRSASQGLMHQPRTPKIHDVICTSLREDIDSLVQFRMIQAMARHGTREELPVLKEFSKRPTPAVPPDIC